MLRKLSLSPLPLARCWCRQQHSPGMDTVMGMGTGHWNGHGHGHGHWNGHGHGHGHWNGHWNGHRHGHGRWYGGRWWGYGSCWRLVQVVTSGFAGISYPLLVEPMGRRLRSAPFAFALKCCGETTDVGQTSYHCRSPLLVSPINSAPSQAGLFFVAAAPARCPFCCRRN